MCVLLYRGPFFAVRCVDARGAGFKSSSILGRPSSETNSWGGDYLVLFEVLLNPRV